MTVQAVRLVELKTRHPRNCRSCKWAVPSCMMCPRDCAWRRVGRKCANVEVPLSQAVPNMIASRDKPEEAIYCSGWEKRS